MDCSGQDLQGTPEARPGPRAAPLAKNISDSASDERLAYIMEGLRWRSPKKMKTKAATTIAFTNLRRLPCALWCRVSDLEQSEYLKARKNIQKRAKELKHQLPRTWVTCSVPWPGSWEHVEPLGETVFEMGREMWGLA